MQIPSLERERQLDIKKLYQAVWSTWYKWTQNLPLMARVVPWIWKGICPAVNNYSLTNDELL